MVPKPKKPKSKRQTLQHKVKVDKRVKEHKRKQRREAKKNPSKRKTLDKDPGLPNLHPFKEKLVRKMQKEEEALKEGNRIRQRRAWEIAERRKQATGDDSKQLRDMMSDAQSRQNQFAANERSKNSEGMDLGSLTVSQAATQTRRAFYRELRKVVEKSDIILEVLDARDPMGSRSPAVEKAALQPVNGKQKRLVFVLNKIDLVPAEAVQKWLKYLRQFHNTIAFKASTQEQGDRLSAAHGARVNRAAREGKSVAGSGAAGAETILQTIKNYSRAGDTQLAVTVGIIGYPNVGKSSVINSLRRAKAVGVSPKPGKTTLMQEIVLDKKVKLLDCPGVIFDTEKDLNAGKNSSASLLLRNCISTDQIEDPSLAVAGILERCSPEQLAKIYTVPMFQDVDGFLASVASSRGKLGKGGVPDRTAAAKLVLDDWNSGRIPFYTLPPEDEKPCVFETDIVDDWSKELDIDALERGDQEAFQSASSADSHLVLKSCEPAHGDAMELDDDFEDEEEELCESDEDAGSDEDMEEAEEEDDASETHDTNNTRYMIGEIKSKATRENPSQPKSNILDEDERKANPQSTLSLKNQEMKKQNRKLRKQQNRSQRENGTNAAEDVSDATKTDDTYDFNQFF